MATCTVQQKVDKILEQVAKLPGMTATRAKNAIDEKALFELVKDSSVAKTSQKTLDIARTMFEKASQAGSETADTAVVKSDIKEEIKSNVNSKDEAWAEYSKMMFSGLSIIKQKTKAGFYNPMLSVFASATSGMNITQQSLGEVASGDIKILDIKSARNIINTATRIPALIDTAKKAKIKELSTNKAKYKKDYDSVLKIKEDERNDNQKAIVKNYESIDADIESINNADTSSVTKEDLLSNLDSIAKEIDERKTTAHEVGHALTKTFIFNNPNHYQVRRLNQLFEIAKVEASKNNGMNNLATVGHGNWQLNIDEFAAELLSNPELVYQLNEVKSDKKHVSQLGSMVMDAMRQLIRVALEQAGFEFDKDSVASQSLESIVKIIKEQVKEEGVSMSNKDKMDLQVKLQKMIKDCR